MFKKGFIKKNASAIAGWAAAALCLSAGILYVNRICSADLSLVLHVDGQPICQVESRATVDVAFLMLEEKLSDSGLSLTKDREITYEYVLTDKKETVTPLECMDLLYSFSSENYARAYTISVKGANIATCATYAEAEQIIDDFEDYIIGQVLEENSDYDLVRLTTEFEIKNVFCRAEDISGADEIYLSLINGGTPHAPEEEPVSDSRVTATGSSSLLSADRNLLYGLPKNSAGESLVGNYFSFSVGGLSSAIEYKTIVIEKYSEIVACQTEYVDSDELYIGQTQVLVEGENGIAENEYEVAYADSVEISRKLISSVVKVEPKNRVELVGTKSYPSTEPTGSFMWPIQQRYIITSPFGSYRDGLDEGAYGHYGIDIAGISIGSPVYAADGGEIIFAGTQGTYGNMVKIQHEDNVVSIYAHLGHIDVKEGDRVYKGQKIAEVGMTGLTTGPHLHFEVRIDKKIVDPMKYLP